jgi:hypothetical protein
MTRRFKSGSALQKSRGEHEKGSGRPPELAGLIIPNA